MFVGGLAIIRSHNLWVRDWTVLVTMSGWLGMGLGLFRMFAASQYQQMSADSDDCAQAFRYFDAHAFRLIDARLAGALGDIF